MGKSHIVCLGGGNAMPKAVLSGLKKYNNIKISAICAMLDSGGSAGRLRKDYKINSPGDLRRAFLALANTSPVIESLFNYRFESGLLRGHNFANLFIVALELSFRRNYEKAFGFIKEFLNINHEVLPVTLDNSELFAVLENGRIIKGETNIDIPKHDGRLKIKKVYLKPQAKAYKKAVEAIKRADLIVIGPGDLYSSLVQILLTKGIPEALKKSKAKKVFICNIMTKYGETNNFSVSDFTNEIEKYAKCNLDYVIYNKKIISKKRLNNFRKKHPYLLDIVKEGNIVDRKKFIGADVIVSKGEIVHDSKKLSKIIMRLLK
jgi:uncharacterized cofD-like protein